MSPRGAIMPTIYRFGVGDRGPITAGEHPARSTARDSILEGAGDDTLVTVELHCYRDTISLRG